MDGAFLIGKMRRGWRISSYLDLEGGELAAAPAGGQRELAGRHKVDEESLDLAAAQAGFPLQRGLIGLPLAARVGVQGDDEEEEAMGAFMARAGEDGHGVVKPQGRHPA